jgi:hypothetical protein
MSLRCRHCDAPLPRAIQLLREESKEPIGMVDFPEELGAMLSCGACGVWSHVRFNGKGAWTDPEPS